jgi:hypothetical protein
MLGDKRRFFDVIQHLERNLLVSDKRVIDVKLKFSFDFNFSLLMIEKYPCIHLQ